MNGWTRCGRRPAKAGRIGGTQVPRRHPEATVPGTEKPRWSAAGRAPFAKGAHAARRGLRCSASRRSIPSGCGPGARKVTTAYPAPPRIGRAERWLFDNCSGDDVGFGDDARVLSDPSPARGGSIALSAIGVGFSHRRKLPPPGSRFAPLTAHHPPPQAGGIRRTLNAAGTRRRWP